MRLTDQQGFTLPEIMVAMIISSIIVSLGLSLFLFADKLFKMWYNDTQLKAAVNRTVQFVSYDVQRSKEMVGVTDSTMFLESIDGKVAAYLFDGKQVDRNDVRLFSSEEGECKFAVKKNAKSRIYNISAEAIYCNSRYQAQTVAAIPYSSRADFHEPH